MHIICIILYIAQIYSIVVIEPVMADLKEAIKKLFSSICLHFINLKLT